MRYWNNNIKGEISVFLSLTLVLILALVGTTIESARVYSGITNAERYMVAAMESVLSEYYSPLYQDYHLFLLDGGYGESQRQDDLLNDITLEYLNTSFNPEVGSEKQEDIGELSQIRLQNSVNMNLMIEDIVGFLDYEYRPFIHEAVSYMKYKTPAHIIESSGEGNAYSKESAKYAEVIEKKIELEETTCKLSESMLDLIRNIEGIKVDKKGVHFNKSNLIKTEKNFVKKFLVVGKDSGSIGISNEVVYKSLEKNYQQPIVWIDEIIGEEKVIIKYLDQLDKLYEELENLSSTESSDSEDEEENRRNEIQAQIEELERKKSNSLDVVRDKVVQLVKLTRGTEDKIDEALSIIPEVSMQQEESNNKCREYEAYLEDNRESIDQEVYSNLQTDKEKIQNYIHKLGNGSQYNLSENRLNSINQTLIHNKETLSAVYPIDQINISSTRSDIDKMINFSTDLKIKISSYEIKELWFDYSSLVIKPEVKNPITNFNKFMEKGILNLVVDDVEKLSKKKINSLDLPSKTIIDKGDKLEEIDLSDGIKDYEKEGNQEKIKEGLGEYGKKGEGNSISKGNELLETALLHEYLMTHFKNQENMLDALDSNVKETRLNYEQEYLVFGKELDYDNYTDMVHRLLLTRTVANFSYLFMDQEKNGLAYATAAALVGFTCLEPLISLTKTMILLIWAYEEALVDIRGLLSKRYVPFLKNKANFQIRYEELLLINKEMIKNKSQSFSLSKMSVNDMCYKDYIKIFLYLTNNDKKCLRAFDLIQENMNLRYKGNFRIKNGIFGFKAIGEFKMDAKFIRFPYVNRVLECDATGYSYTIKKENSY